MSLIVFYAPLEVEVQAVRLAGRSALSARLASLCERESVAFADVGAALARERHEGLFLDDVHLTPRGHHVVAAALQAPLHDAIFASRTQRALDGAVSHEVSLDSEQLGRRHQPTREGMQ